MKQFQNVLEPAPRRFRRRSRIRGLWYVIIAALAGLAFGVLLGLAQ